MVFSAAYNKQLESVKKVELNLDTIYICKYKGYSPERFSTLFNRIFGKHEFCQFLSGRIHGDLEMVRTKKF